MEEAAGVFFFAGEEVVEHWSVQLRGGQSLAALTPSQEKWLPPDSARGGMSQRGGRAKDKFLLNQRERPHYEVEVRNSLVWSQRWLRGRDQDARRGEASSPRWAVLIQLWETA